MYYFFLEKQNTLTQGWKLREVAFDPKYCYLYYSAPIARADLNSNNTNNDDNTYTDAEANDQYSSVNESKSKRLMRSNEKECLELQSKLSDKTKANENNSNATLSYLNKDSSKSKKCEEEQENTMFSPKYNSVSKVHREPSRLYCEDKVQKVDSVSLTSSSQLVPRKSVPFAIPQQNIPIIRKSKKIKKWVQWRHKIKLTELQYAADDYAVSARSNDFDEKILLTFTVTGLERSLNPPASSQSTFSHTRTNSSRGTSTIFGMSPSLSACNESAEHDCKEQFDDADDNNDDGNGAKTGWSANHNDSNYFSISGSGSNNRIKIKEDEMLLQPEYPSMLLQDDPNVTLPMLPNDVENEPEDVFRDNELIASDEDSADEDTSEEESEEEEESSSSEEDEEEEEEEKLSSSSSSTEQEKQSHKYKNNKLLKKNVYGNDGYDDKESTSSIPSSPTPTHTPHRFGFSWFRRKTNKPITITFRALNYDTFRIVSLRLRQALVRHGWCAPLHRGLPVYDPRNGIALATVPLHLRHVFHRLNDTVFYSLQCGHAVYIRQFREVRALYGYLCITHDSLYFLQEDGKCPRWLDLEDVTGVDYVLRESSSFVAVKAAAPYVDFIFLPVFPLYPPCVDFDHEETVDGIVSMLRRLFVQRLRLHEEVSLPPPSPVLEMEPQSTSTTQNNKLSEKQKQDIKEHELVMEKQEEMEKVKNEEPARKVVESIEDAEDNEDYDILCHIKDRSREFTDVFKYVAARGAAHLMPGRGVSWKTPQHFTYKRDLALALAEEEQDIDKGELYRDKLIKHDSVRSKDRQGSRKSSRANNAIHASYASFSSYSNKNNYNLSTTNTSTDNTSINTKVKAKLPFPAHSEDVMPSAQVKRYIVTQGDRGNMYFPPPPPTSAENWHSSRGKYYDDDSSSSINHKNNINKLVQGHRQRSSLMSQASFTAMTVSHLLAPPSRDAELRAKDKLQMSRTDPIKRQERQARLICEQEHVKQSTLSLPSSPSCTAANTVNVPLSSTFAEQKQGQQYEQTKMEMGEQQKRKAKHKVMLSKHIDPTHDISLSATFTHSPDQNNKLNLVETNSSTRTSSTSASSQTHLQSSTPMRSSRPTSYGLKPAPAVLQKDSNTINQSLTSGTDNKNSNITSCNVMPAQIAGTAAIQKTMALTCTNDLEQQEQHKTKADLIQTPTPSTVAFPVHVNTNNTNTTSSLSSLFSPTSAMIATNKQSPVIATNRGIKIPLPFPAKLTNTDIISNNNNNSKDNSSRNKEKTHNNDDNTHICHEDKRNANALEDLMIFTTTNDPVTKSIDQNTTHDFVKNNDTNRDKQGKSDEINTTTLALTKQSTPNVQQQPPVFSVEQEQKQKDEVRKDNTCNANIENVFNDIGDEEEAEEDEEEDDDDEDDAFDSEDVDDLLQKV